MKRTPWTLLLLMGLAMGIALFLMRGKSCRAETLVETESLYHHIIVESDGSIHRLLFRRRGVDESESAVDVAHPLKPQMRYLEAMFSGLLFCDQPKDILVIGLGGGTLSRMYAHYFDQATVTSVELDQTVYDLARKHFLFQDGARTPVVVRDGRVYVKRTLKEDKPRFDMIMLDAYRGGFIPFHLTTKEFLIECQKLLKPSGLIVCNLRTDIDTYDYQRRTMKAVFPSCYAFRGGGNMIVCALNTKTDVTDEDLFKRASALQQKHRFEFDLIKVAENRESQPGYTEKGDILTDDYAPVNIQRRK